MKTLPSHINLCSIISQLFFSLNIPSKIYNNNVTNSCSTKSNMAKERLV